MSSVDTEYRRKRMSVRAHLGSALATAAVFAAIASTGVRLQELEPDESRERPVYYLAPPQDYVETKAVAPETSLTVDTSSLNVSVQESAPELNFESVEVELSPDISSDYTLNLEMSRTFQAAAPTMSEFDSFTIYDHTEVDVRPKLRYAATPTVHRTLRGEEVEVVVFYYVNDKGRTERQSILFSSSDNPAYGDAAKEALKLWRFKPAQKNGEAVPCWIQQTIKFNRGSTSPFSI